MSTETYISVVIPSYNSSTTIGKCLEAAFASDYKNFEVIVVDDYSSDASVEIIRKFPCRLVTFSEHKGTSSARNAGALTSKGEYIFFTDSDCLLNKDTLAIIDEIISKAETDVIIGGTYTKRPYDKGFFNLFQSLFVYYSETKRATQPDYLAAHAMVINSGIFRKNRGFAENFMPIIEDVEFTHRLRRAGYQLVIHPTIQVRHIFNFSMYRSLKNAVKKSLYWTIYSIGNRDLFADSGSASTELKVNVGTAFLSLLIVFFSVLAQQPSLLYPLAVLFVVNIFVSRGLIQTFYETGGMFFCVVATVYYTLCYSLAVGVGTAAGMMRCVFCCRQMIRENGKKETQRKPGAHPSERD